MRKFLCKGGTNTIEINDKFLPELQPLMFLDKRGRYVINEDYDTLQKLCENDEEKEYIKSDDDSCSSDDSLFESIEIEDDSDEEFVFEDFVIPNNEEDQHNLKFPLHNTDSDAPHLLLSLKEIADFGRLVFVTNFGPSTSTTDLELFFEDFHPSDVKILKHHATIEFSNCQNAYDAFKLLNFNVLNGKNVLLYPNLNRYRENPNLNLNLYNLNPFFKSHTLWLFFKEELLVYCEVDSSKAHGLLTFVNEQSASSFLHKYNGKTILNNKITVTFIKSDIHQHDSDFFLFVFDVPQEMDEKKLSHLFQNFGSIIKVDLPKNEYGTNRGIAFIKFEDSNAVKRLLKIKKIKYQKNKYLKVRKYKRK